MERTSSPLQREQQSKVRPSFIPGSLCARQPKLFAFADCSDWRSYRALVHVQAEFQQWGDKGLLCKYIIDAREALPPAALLPSGLHNSLPRVGIKLDISGGSWDTAEYLGLGPIENYPDRCTAALFRRHRQAGHPLLPRGGA